MVTKHTIGNDTRAGIIALVEQEKERRHWSDAQLCRKLGIAASQWSRIKSGQRDMSLEFVRAVARVFPALKLKLASFAVEGP